MELFKIINAVLVFILLAAYLIDYISKSSKMPEYIKIRFLLTEQEKRFHSILSIVCENRYTIQSKVRVADVIKPKPTRNRKKWFISFNKIKSKHFDFVLCNPTTFAPIIVIELDDNSHNMHKNKQRDIVKNNACKSSGLPLLRHRIQMKYDPSDLTKRINQSLREREP